MTAETLGRRTSEAHKAFDHQSRLPGDVGDVPYTNIDSPTPLSASSWAYASFERKLGDSEASYFLPSRDDGVNDMYLHIGFNAPLWVVERARVVTVWAIMRIRHPLLAAKISMDAYDDVSFLYNAPRSVDDTLREAERNIEYRKSKNKDELIDSYLNGARMLSNERLSYLIISNRSEEQAEMASNEADQNIDVMICAAHFLGDGTALAQCANDLFRLLGSALDLAGLASLLAAEWLTRCPEQSSATCLPPPLEERLATVTSTGKFRRLVSRVDYELSQQKHIGGHSFSRVKGKPRHTVVLTLDFDRHSTKEILSKCKSHGVSISASLFAICNLAWARTCRKGRENPIMMYSALSMRPNLHVDARLHDSYWFLAISYFNVILPSFFPNGADTPRMFWHRAAMAKAQISAAARSPMCVSRCALIAHERGRRARAWAKEDDDRLAGTKDPNPVFSVPPQLQPAPPPTALIGLSLLGNLDAIYEHGRFPDIKCHTMTTGSRQRPGGILFFGYTFAGKLWLSLGYDENGLNSEEVKGFWTNARTAVDEFLL